MPPKAKASKAAAAPLACVASVLQDEDLMAIVLEQGGLSIMAATSLSKSSVKPLLVLGPTRVSFPLVCKGRAKVAKRVSARWGVLRWDHRGSEGKLLVKDSPYEVMEFGMSGGASIVSVPSLGAKTADSSILVCSTYDMESHIDLVNIRSSITEARQHRLYNKCSRSSFLRVRAAAVAVAPPYLYVMNEDPTNAIHTHRLATSPAFLATFGTEGKGDGQFRFKEGSMAYCASLNLLAVCDRLNDRVVLLNTSTTSPKLSFACSTRGEDEGGRPQLTKPAAISEHNGLLFVGSKSKIVVLSVHDNGRGVRLERSMGGKGSALASLKPKSGCFPFTVHRDALYVIGEQHLGVLSLNGVLRQKIRIPVSSPIVTTICVDDKHAYIHLCASSGVLGGGRNASGLYILEKVQISVAGSSTA